MNVQSQLQDFFAWGVAAESRDVTVVRETLDRKVSAQGRVMPEKLIAQPYLQRDSRGIVRSIGEATFALVAVFGVLLLLVCVTAAMRQNPVAPEIRAGLGFFFCMGVFGCYGLWWLYRSEPHEGVGLVVGDRVVKIRMHRDEPVFSAEQCLYFLEIESNAAYRSVISGLKTGRQIFYLEDGAYLTDQGIEATIGLSASRRAVKFKRYYKVFKVGGKRQ